MVASVDPIARRAASGHGRSKTTREDPYFHATEGLVCGDSRQSGSATFELSGRIDSAIRTARLGLGA